MSTNIRVKLPPFRPDESLILVIEKHWVTSLVINVMFIFFGTLPLIVATLFGEWLSTRVSGLWFFLYLFINIAIIGGLFLLALIHRRNEKGDMIILTTQRLISHEQVDLFHRKMSETGLAQIQDVKGIEKGFLQNILHYGTLEITTASSDVFFKIKNINKPYMAARAILEARDQQIKNS